jgi:hypothetical protein
MYKVSGTVAGVAYIINQIAAQVTTETLIVSEEKQADGRVVCNHYVIKPAVNAPSISAATVDPAAQNMAASSQNNSEEMFSESQPSQTASAPMMSTQIGNHPAPAFDPCTQMGDAKGDAGVRKEPSESTRKPLFKPKKEPSAKQSEKIDGGEEEEDDFAKLKTYRSKRRNSSIKESSILKRSKPVIEYIDSDEEVRFLSTSTILYLIITFLAGRIDDCLSCLWA